MRQKINVLKKYHNQDDFDTRYQGYFSIKTCISVIQHVNILKEKKTNDYHEIFKKRHLIKLIPIHDRNSLANNTVREHS